MIDYSIYMRSLGKGGEKYQKTLNAIDNLDVKPQKVVVVLPFGYEPPKERLGYECFEYCNKGMVSQRAYAIDRCCTEYVLLLDDDVEFEPAFVSKLFSLMSLTGATVGEAYVEVHENILRSFIEKICLVSGFNHTKDYHGIINRAGGYASQKMKSERIMYEQSGHGTHCFAKTSALKLMHFEEEQWLDESSYALPDDQVFFYKLWLLGNKIVYSDAYFKHLDAKSTRSNDRYKSLFYAKGRNYLIFWYRFIFKYARTKRERFLCKLAIVYRHYSELFLMILPMSLLKLDFSLLLSFQRGWEDGKKFIVKEMHCENTISK